MKIDGVTIVLALLVSTATAFAQAPVTYRVSFPAPQHRFAEIDVVFPEVGSDPLEVRMSRTSPGRYALHEFARNVFDVRAFDGSGRALALERPNPHQWTVADHDGTVRVTYRVYGDRVDGTFLAIDSTHAHMNMPATLMWARRMENRPVRITFDRPTGSDWNVATQLHPTNDPLTFTAANLQYLMDSPAEFGDFSLRTFTVDLPAVSATSSAGREATIRLALHHAGTERDEDELVEDVATIVRETGAIFGEFPPYDVGYYTFLADYLPYASGDGMEHRNSTVLTSSGSLADDASRAYMVGTIAHEFFHGWNVERIRPRSLEPFDFEEANMSGLLWLAEGFTSYYQTLVMQRTGLASLAETAFDFSQTIDAVTRSPGRQVRSAVEMSRLAPFVDAAEWVDRTNWDNLYISYYTWGAALGLALDLSLRDHTDGRVTLDDYMRLMWRVYGQPAAPVEGVVARPYTLGDARDRLAEVSGDRAFADEFFDRFVEGRDVADYAALLEPSGLVLRNRSVGQSSLGSVRFRAGSRGVTVAAPTPFGSPLYDAGVNQDDEILSLDGETLSGTGQLTSVLRRRRPGDTVSIAFLRRGERVTGRVTLAEEQRLEVVPVERAGGTLTAAQRAFRQAWLGTKQ